MRFSIGAVNAPQVSVVQNSSNRFARIYVPGAKEDQKPIRPHANRTLNSSNDFSASTMAHICTHFERIAQFCYSEGLRTASYSPYVLKKQSPRGNSSS
jgi:hypothetical protein